MHNPWNIRQSSLWWLSPSLDSQEMKKMKGKYKHSLGVYRMCACVPIYSLYYFLIESAGWLSISKLTLWDGLFYTLYAHLTEKSVKLTVSIFHTASSWSHLCNISSSAADRIHPSFPCIEPAYFGLNHWFSHLSSKWSPVTQWATVCPSSPPQQQVDTSSEIWTA